MRDTQRRCEYRLAQLIKKENVIFFDTTVTKSSAISLLTDTFTSLDASERAHIVESVKGREEIVSTGIGLGVALPHARLEGDEEFRVSVGIARNPGVEWNSIDGAPVYLAFLIAGPEKRQSEYLLLLSEITTFIRSEAVRSSLVQATSQDDVLQIIKRSAEHK